MSETHDLAAAAAGMESVGRNCEFGLVQRRAGVDPLGLLRFAESPLGAVIKAITSRFEGLRAGLTLTVSRNGEWLSHWGGLTFHSDRQAHDISEDAVRAQEARRLPWLAEKLLMDIRAAEKTFVFCDRDTTDPNDAVPLLDALRQIGDARLLVAVAAPQDAGTIDRSSAPLLIARLSRLAPTYHATEFDWPSWQGVLSDMPRAAPSADLPPGFDPGTYLALNPDVAAAGMMAPDHYQKHGWREGRRWKRA